MPAVDRCEPQIIRALEKEGWVVLDKPYMIRTPDEYLYADLRLQERENQHDIIVVEVKCFPESTTVREAFYLAVGQYLTYTALIINVPVYLAIPRQIYDTLSQRTSVMRLLTELRIRLVVVDLDQEVVTQWIH